MNERPDGLDDASLARRRFIKAAAGLAVAGGLVAGAGWSVIRRRQNLFEVRRERTLMQTSVAVTCLADDMDAARAAIEAAFLAMSAAAAVLTRFDPGSAVSRLNRDGYLAQVPSSLREVMQHALAISSATAGAFDVSVLPVLGYVESLRRPVRLTANDRDAITRRDHLIDYRNIVLGERDLRLTRPGMGITLDGIAKGYVVDQGIAALRSCGIEYGLVDAGGDVQSMAGADPQWHWNVGIVDPHDVSRVAAVVQLRNGCLSTSGNYRVFFSADRRLFHLINPRTGYSPDSYSSVTVMADRSVIADGMSTASFSMDFPQLRSLMASRNHAWLVFSRTGPDCWRSRELPLIAGQAEIA